MWADESSAEKVSFTLHILRKWIICVECFSDQFLLMQGFAEFFQLEDLVLSPEIKMKRTEHTDLTFPTFFPLSEKPYSPEIFCVEEDLIKFAF